ncbi:unnamed protein product [Peniophora sp. CBMAI 1063]|nr:unnamed protein product [Peniophora sp. CBMAI 1063]
MTARLDGRPEQLVTRRLPTDVIYEFFSAAAAIDPPIRNKHFSGSSRTTSPRRSNTPRECLGPDWSRLPSGPSEHEEYATLSTYRLWDVPPTLGWIRYTHVCKEWRNIGLSMPGLWGDIFPIFPFAAETVLARSREQPLSMDMDLVGFIEYPRILRPDHIRTFFDLAQQNIQRARVLTVNHRHDHFTDWDITPALGAQLPFLEVLRFSRDRTSARASGLTLSAPALTHAILGTFIPFSAPSLRFLQLYDLSIKLQPDVLADVLRATPLLEELKLGWVIPERLSVAPNEAYPPVHLPRLVAAHFEGPPLSLAFAGLLRIPLDAELKLRITKEHVGGGAILPLLDALAPHLQNPSIDRISFDPDYDVEVCLASSSSTASTDMERTRRFFIKLSHRSTYDSTLRGPLHFLSQIIRRMEAGNVTFLHAHPFAEGRRGSQTDLAYYVSQAERVLQQLTVMTTLSLAWLPVRHQPFLSALGANKDLVETLVVRSDDMLIAYDSPHPMSGSRTLVTAAESVQTRWKEVVDTLERRASVGSPLKRLILGGLLGDATDPDVKQAAMVSLASDLVDEVIDERRCL